MSFWGKFASSMEGFVGLAGHRSAATSHKWTTGYFVGQPRFMVWIGLGSGRRPIEAKKLVGKKWGLVIV